MNQHNEKKEILRKYYKQIPTSVNFYIEDTLSGKLIDNARNGWIPNLKTEEILGFYDTTVFGNGKNGFMFTDTKVYYLETLEKTKKLWYDDIKSVELIYPNKKKDCDKGLLFKFYDGTTVAWNSSFLNKTPLLHFFQEMIELINGNSNDYEDWSKEDDIKYQDSHFV